MKHISKFYILITVLLTACVTSTPNLEPGGNYSKKVLHDFSIPNANLNDIDFSEAKLDNIDLSSSSLKNANFSNAQGTQVNFSDADLTDADFLSSNFSGCNFSGADFSRGILLNANFSGADLSEANLSGAELWDTNFSEANLSGAIMNGFLINEYTDFSGANLSGVDFRDDSLHDVNLSGVNLSNADFHGATLGEIDLSKANLSSADFSSSYFDGADLGEANLSGADFSDAIFYDADLTGADLSGANLSYADLGGADFSDANLTGANLQGANTENCIGLTEDMVLSAAVQSKSFILETFISICTGPNYVSQAAAYNPSAISPLIMITSDLDYRDVSSKLPSSWVSSGIELTQLVVCINNEEAILLETCKYDGPDVKRYQHKYKVTVYQAMTGEIFGRETFLGTEPRECSEKENYDLRRLDGGIDFDPIIEWLCQYVDPACASQ